LSTDSSLAFHSSIRRKFERRTTSTSRRSTITDHQRKERERAADISSDAAHDAAKHIDKAQDSFVKDEAKAAEKQDKQYQKAAKDDDAADANERMRKADKKFAERDLEANEKLGKGYDKAAKDLEHGEAKAKNRDPMTGAPGSHPVGTGVGTVAGAAAGAAAGSLAGPVGTAVGGLVGAIAGAAAGHSAGEAINPTVEEKYWSSAYGKEPYYDKKYSYDDYAPAYRAGYMGREEYRDLTWDEAEPRIASNWNTLRGKSSLEWKQARMASRAAWDRVENC